MATYAEIISSAIADFDSIYDALKSRLATSDGSTILTDSKKSDGTIPTSAYAGLIGQLYRVGTVDATKTSITAISPTLVDGAIKDYSGDQSAGATTQGTPTTTAIPVSLTISNAGYYAASTRINGSIAFNDINITKDNITNYATNSSSNTSPYLIRNLDGTKPTNVPMLSVSIPHGKVDVSYGDNNSSLSMTKDEITSDIAIESDTSSIQKPVLGAATTGTSNDYKFQITKTARYKGTGSIAPTINKTAGFILDSNLDVEVDTPTFSIDTSMTPATQDIYIPAGTVSGRLADSASVSISGDSDLGLTTGDEPTGSYYTLTASTANLTILGSTTHGYIPDQNNITLGTVANKTKNYYINGTTIPNTEVEITSANITSVDNNTDIISDTSTSYKISVGVSKGNTIKNFSKGFTNNVSYTVSVKNTSGKDIYIKSGHIENTAVINIGNVEGTGSNIITSGNGDYTISIPVNASVSTSPFTPTGSSSAGYISNISSQVTNNNATPTTLTYHVRRGSVTVTPSLTATLTESDNDGIGSVTGKVIFSEQKPATNSGDYYTITASASRDGLSSGYIKDNSDVTIGDPKIYYLKKAKFKYVKDMGNQERSFLEVTDGGYVPSGLIANIASITGDIDYASVGVELSAISGSKNIIKSTSTDLVDPYPITVAKGTIGAGYISSEEGVIAETTYCIAKGSISINTSLNGNSTIKTIENLNTQNNTYKVNIGTSITNSVNPFTEGYITAEEVSLDGGTTSGTNNQTLGRDTAIYLNRGVFGITAKSIALGIGDNPDIDTVESGGYEINPVLSSASFTIDATTAGYIKSGDSRIQQTFNNSSENLTKTGIRIKKGTGPLNGNTDWTVDTDVTTTATLGDNFGSTQSGKYTITLGGTAKAALTLNTGYYGDNEKEITGGTVALHGTKLIDHGHVNVVLQEGTNTLTSSNANALKDSATGLNNNYITIQSQVTVSSSGTSVTPGYIKNVDGDMTRPTTDPIGQTKYIQTSGFGTTTLTGPASDFNNTTTTPNIPNGTTVYGGTAYTIGSNSGEITHASSYATITVDETGLRDGIILPTKNKYALYDTKIVLTTHAMGLGVKNELARLSSRLAGKLATS